MKRLSIDEQGIKGGLKKTKTLGYVNVQLDGDKIFSVDNYLGAGDSYQQRENPIICIFNNGEVVFEGTHKQLIDKLTEKQEKIVRFVAKEDTELKLYFDQNSFSLITAKIEKGNDIIGTFVKEETIENEKIAKILGRRITTIRLGSGYMVDINHDKFDYLIVK